MSNLWQRLVNKFRGKSTGNQRRHIARRRLKMEMLENRQLLASDLGAISGVVFTDVTDNGLTADDALIQGAQVRLFLDGGDGTFNNGGGDDTEITTGTSTPSPQTTDAQGAYRFDELEAGTYFVVQDAFPGQLQRGSQTVQTVVITPAEASVGSPQTTIDSFDDTTQIATATVGGPTPVDDATDAPEAIGGERDFFVDATSGTNGNTLELQADTGGVSDLLTFASGPGVSGARIVTYDGNDDDGQTLDATGLGGISLTTGDAEAFRFEIGTDLAGTDVTIRVFTDGANSSTITQPIPVTPGGTATETLIVRFADFATLAGSGADFTNVGAIQISFEGSAAGDGEVDQFETVAPSVETINFANLNPLSIGNELFLDPNNNGVSDAGEGNVGAGVSVQLFEDTDTDGVFTPGTDALVSGTGITNPATTDASGLYTFDNLLPGEYFVVIPEGQAPLTGFASSTGNDPAPDPDDGVDNDDNGTAIAGIGIVSAAITLSAGGEPTNDADTDPNTNTTIDFGFVPEVDVEIVKTARNLANDADITALPAGEQINYRLTVTNNGPNDATNVVITDLLPQGISFVSGSLPGGTVISAPDVGDPNRTLVTGNLTNLPSGDTVLFDLLVTVDAAATGTLTNESDVSSDGIETDLTNNSSDLPLPVNRVAVLDIVKTDSPDPVSAGNDVTYTITVTNQGPSTATNVVINDPDLPDVTFSNPQIVISNPTETTGAVNVTADAIDGTVPSLAVGQVATITFVGTVSGTFTGTNILNTATANADEAILVTANEDTTIQRDVDLTILKDGPATAIAGQNFTYTFTVQNNGPSGSTGATVADVLPTGLNFVSFGNENGVVGAFNAANNELTFDLPDLAAGAPAITFTAVVMADTDAPDMIINSATVTPGTGATDTDLTNNSDDATTVINREADLSITKTDNVANVDAGGQLTYTIVVTNNGPSTVNNATVTDPQIAGVTFSSGSSTDAGVAVNVPPVGSTADLTANIAVIDPGESITITVIGDVDPTARGTVTNTATVSVPAGVIETDTSNNSASDSTDITTNVVLGITKTDSVDPVIAGNDLTYTIVVTNTGVSTATNVQVSDPLPAGVTFSSGSFVSPDNANGTVVNTAGTITAALGSLDPNESATITVLVGVDGTTRGTLSNTASVTSAEITAPVTDTEPTAVNATLDVSIVKSGSATTAQPGETLTYTLVVNNSGPSTAQNVQVSDAVPSEVTITSVTSTSGTVTNVGNQVTGDLGDLAAGETVTITIVTTVNAAVQAQVTNTATVTTTDTETTTANNSSSVQTLLTPNSNISGQVFVDSNQNGVLDAGEQPIAGVTVNLTGTDFLGATVNQSVQTNAEGEYQFENLLPGTYTVTQVQPDGFDDGAEAAGTNGSAVSNNDEFTITLGAEDSAVNNFGEVVTDFSKRRFLASAN